MVDRPDRATILARRRRFMQLALGGVAAAAGATACPAPCLNVAQPLLSGGVFVVTAWAKLVHGDVIRTVDDRWVHTVEALEAALLDGQHHQLGVDRGNGRSPTLWLDVMFEDALPFLAVSSDALAQAPTWARRRLHGHGLPELGLVSLADGEPLDGGAWAGKRWLVALVELGNADTRLDAALTLQVMQKAQADLQAASVELVYALTAGQTHAEASGLETFMAANQVSAKDGGPLPLVPAYAEADAKRPAFNIEQLGESPNLLVLDERGVVRWHSAGSVPDPSGEIQLAMVYSAIEAVIFARDLKPS